MCPFVCGFSHSSSHTAHVHPFELPVMHENLLENDVTAEIQLQAGSMSQHQAPLLWGHYYSEGEARAIRKIELAIFRSQRKALKTIALVMPCGYNKKQFASWTRNQTLKRKLETQLYQATGYRRTVNPWGCHKPLE